MNHKPEKTQPLVYAVVTNWNGLEDTTECLASTLASDYPNLKIILVDNGSTDDSASTLAQNFPEVDQVQTGKNGAITAAYNMGMQYGLDRKADYILMLNNDTVLAPDMISKMVQVAEADETIGQVTPKIYYYDQPQTIWFAGGKRSWFDFGAYDTHEGLLDSPQNNVAKEVDFAWACGMLMRRSLLEKMGLFDTQFYLYYDDVDTSIRTQQAGYRIWYEPGAKMWHKVSHSTGSAKFAYIWARSKMRLYLKHAHGIHKAILIFYAFIHGIFRILVARQDNLRPRVHTRSYFTGLLDGLIGRERLI
ncbi:MAG: glycosyltransferase family 2 protein [Bacteroidetes bacterium]|nr:glycosyltransferase family 2 protein [Bacteroidota bacterium]